MSVSLRTLLLVCVLPCLAQSLVVGSAQRSPLAVGRPAAALRPGLTMKSKEDKEFEEWMAKKRAAAGVDATEDFGTSRRVESSIYAIGGAIAIAVPVIAGLWAYNEGYLTPQ
jgi:hypothetical protein